MLVTLLCVGHCDSWVWLWGTLFFPCHRIGTHLNLIKCPSPPRLDALAFACVQHLDASIEYVYPSYGRVPRQILFQQRLQLNAHTHSPPHTATNQTQTHNKIKPHDAPLHLQRAARPPVRGRHRPGKHLHACVSLQDTRPADYARLYWSIPEVHIFPHFALTGHRLCPVPARGPRAAKHASVQRAHVQRLPRRLVLQVRLPTLQKPAAHCAHALAPSYKNLLPTPTPTPTPNTLLWTPCSYTPATDCT